MEQYQKLRDQLTGCLIGLARATDGNEHLISDSSTAVIVKSLSYSGKDCATLEALMKSVTEEKRKMVPDCFHCASPCGKNSDYDLQRLENADQDVQNLKLLLLLGVRGLAACCSRTGNISPGREVSDLFYKSLIVIGMEDYGAEDLLPIVMELSELSRMCLTVFQPKQIQSENQTGILIGVTERDASDLQALVMQQAIDYTVYSLPDSVK